MESEEWGPSRKGRGQKAHREALPVGNAPVAELLERVAGGDVAEHVLKPGAEELHSLGQHHWGRAGRGAR